MLMNAFSGEIGHRQMNTRGFWSIRLAETRLRCEPGKMKQLYLSDGRKRWIKSLVGSAMHSDVRFRMAFLGQLGPQIAKPGKIKHDYRPFLPFSVTRTTLYKCPIEIFHGPCPNQKPHPGNKIANRAMFKHDVFYNWIIDI